MRVRRAGQGLAALLVAGLAFPALLRAEPLYVIEQLAVNVNSAPDASGERVATLKSGDRVEELERAGDEVHVRLANGRDGWVRASYLSATEPLRVRLAQREAEVARLNEELSALKAQSAPTPAAGTAANPAANARGTVQHRRGTRTPLLALDARRCAHRLWRRRRYRRTHARSAHTPQVRRTADLLKCAPRRGAANANVSKLLNKSVICCLRGEAARA